ncbi:phage tail protein [Betaproteobacteria bacterium GR16-43]|nr:phage tail protein [Betaproteobacteria bacterium GR16-43]
MAEKRDNPYGAFNFLVSLEDANDPEAKLVGGFSDVSGLGRELNYADYRNGNERLNTPRKVANTFKQEDVTLKRGLVGSVKIFQWLKEVSQDGRYLPKQVTIKLLDEARKEVATFRLLNAQPKKWVGPTLAAKGGGEVAMEELHLVHEGITYE